MIETGWIISERLLCKHTHLQTPWLATGSYLSEVGIAAATAYLKPILSYSLCSGGSHVRQVLDNVWVEGMRIEFCGWFMVFLFPFISHSIHFIYGDTQEERVCWVYFQENFMEA